MSAFLMKRFIISLLCCAFCILPHSVTAQTQQDELYATALRAFDDGFYDVAIRYLEQISQDFPSNPKLPQVKFLLGQCYFLKNKYAEALSMFDSLKDVYDNKELLLFWSAEVYLKMKDYGQAQTKYQEFIKRYPESAYLPQAYYSFAWLLFDQKKFVEAKEMFEQLLTSFPKHQLSEDASLKVAQCLYDLGNYQAALRGFIRYLTHYPQSQNQMDVYLNVADTYYYMEDYENARNYYDKVLKASDTKMVLTAYAGKVWSFLKQRKFTEAEKILKEAQEFCRQKQLPDDDLLLVKANMLLEKGDVQDAVEAYADLIKKFPRGQHYIEAHLGRANANFILKKFDEALGDYSYVADRGNNEELALKANLGIAWVYAKLNSISQAQWQFQKIIDGTNKSEVKINASIQMADALSDAGQLEQARSIYEGIITNNPNYSMIDYVYHRQAVTLLKLEKTKAAIDAFENLKIKFPKSKYLEDVNFYLGLADFKKNNFKNAALRMEDFLKNPSGLSDFMPEANYILALSYLNLKQSEEALKLFQKILRLYPDDAHVAKNADIGIAKCQYELGQVKEAVKRFKLIIYKYPKTEAEYESLLWLAQFYLKNADYAQALDFYQQILDHFSSHGGLDQVNYEMGQAYEIQGLYEQALSRYKQISSQDKALSSKVKLAIAGIFAKEFDAKKADEAYEAIAKDSPDIARDSYLKIAQLYRNNQTYEKEIETYQKALNIPQGSSAISNAELLFDVADTYELMGRLDEAADGYLKIPAQYPQETSWAAKAYLRVARIFEDRKDWTGARVTYQKIIQLDCEESKFAQERLDWINTSTGGKK